MVFPTNERSFQDRIKAKTSDYLRPFSMFPDRSWKEQYQPQVLEPVQSLIQTARHVGVTVFEDARLADLSLATKNHETVALFSHWKGPAVEFDDLPDEGNLAIKLPEYPLRVLNPASASGKWLRCKFKQHPPKTARELRGVMNEFIETQNVLQERIGGFGIKVRATKFTIRTWNRDELDSLFEGLLLPGNRVEFSDGLYPKEAAATAIDKDFSGILDLTTCTSTVLSDNLDRTSRGAYRTVQFVEPQDPPLSCPFLEHTFRLCGEGMDYGKARKQAKLDFEKIVETLADEQQPRGFWVRFFSKFMRRS